HVRRQRKASVAVLPLLDVAELALLERGPRPCPASRSAIDAGDRRFVGAGLVRLADRTPSLAARTLFAVNRPPRTACWLAGRQAGLALDCDTRANARPSAPRARRIACRAGATAIHTLPIWRQGRGHPVLLWPARPTLARPGSLARYG